MILGFETLDLKFCELKLRELTVASNVVRKLSQSGSRVRMYGFRQHNTISDKTTSAKTTDQNCDRKHRRGASVARPLPRCRARGGSRGPI